MFKKIPIFVFAIAWASSTALGQYPGDECSYALSASDGPNAFTTIGASPSTPEPDESICPGTSLNWNTSPDIWLKYLPTTTGTHTFSTCDNTSYDTSIVLYEGGCTYQVACNGDDPAGNSNCQNYYSLIEYTLIGGIEYYIRIGGWNGATGTGTLTIDPPSSNAYIWYVDIDNATPGSGTDWASSFAHVQDALNVAGSGDQIWVAEGTYRAVDTDGSSDPRDAAFRLNDGVSIYGGFAGYETNLDERRPADFVALLTGDVNGDDDGGGDSSENAYHVVIADGISTISPVIDGIYIGAGNANGLAKEKYGGGIFVTGTTAVPAIPLLVQGCRIRFNEAIEGGGIATYSSYDSVSIFNSIVANNTASYGGAIGNNGTLRIESSFIGANKSYDRGGAIYNAGTKLQSINTTIVQNRSGYIGGVYSSSGTIHGFNNIVWGNTDEYGSNQQLFTTGSSVWNGTYNCVQNEILPGIGNTDLPPRFVDEFGDDGVPGTGDENFSLLQLSPCIDAGDTTMVSVQKDLAGNDRVVDDIYTQDTGVPGAAGNVVDMGCHEHLSGSNDVLIWEGANSYYFYDALNWLPQGYPMYDSKTLFNSVGFQSILFADDADIHSLSVTEGSFTLDLRGWEFLLHAPTRALRVDPFSNGASLQLKNGFLRTENTLSMSGDLTFTNMTLNVGDMWLEAGSSFKLTGTVLGNVTNEGGILSTSGSAIGEMNFVGALLNQVDGNTTGRLIGSLPFDIAGRDPGVTYDHLNVSSAADMTCSIDLRWNENFTPLVGDSFDIMSVGSSTGHPTVVYNSGLPSDLTTRWITPTGLRGGTDVIIETTGPILFDAGETTAISSGTPNDIVVADLNNDGYPDVAMSVPAIGGVAGSIIIHWNDGMVGGVWQGFTEDTPITVGVDPMDIEVGDFNGDGTANDLVVANNGDDDVSILDNDNTGSFTKTDVSTDVGPLYIAIGEYVEDALVLDDIVVACSSFKASVLTNASSFRGRAISFTHTNSINIPSPGDIKPGDVNHDKDLDFVILDVASEEVRVLEGTGNGTTPPMFVVGSPLPSGSAPVQLAFSDLDRDGINDAITVNEGTGSLSVLLGDGSDLGNTSSFTVGTSPLSMAIHDFDNDGDDDLIVSLIGDVSGNRELQLIRNDTSTTIVLSAGDAFSSGIEPILVNAGDFDQDGLQDVVSITDLNPLVGQNSPAITVNFNRTAVVVACPSDIDGSGTVDVDDLLLVIGAWGTASSDEDIDNNGTVDVDDLLILISAWGPC